MWAQLQWQLLQSHRLRRTAVAHWRNHRNALKTNERIYDLNSIQIAEICACSNQSRTNGCPSAGLELLKSVRTTIPNTFLLNTNTCKLKMLKIGALRYPEGPRAMVICLGLLPNDAARIINPEPNLYSLLMQNIDIKWRRDRIIKCIMLNDMWLTTKQR